jgi:hypothetical protein
VIGGVVRAVMVAAVIGLAALPARADPAAEVRVIQSWYRLILELVRHTPTYSPPVASRSFAYLGVTAFEAKASGDAALVSLEGQLNGLAGLPDREAGVAYNDAVILQAALSASALNFFPNTGPSGQRAMAAMTERLDGEVAEGIATDVAARSRAYGEALAAAIRAWSATDGGAVVENLGFPLTHELGGRPESWVPTSTIRLQQTPLLPGWGAVRTFAMPDGGTCPLPPPPAFSEDPASPFYAEAMEVVEVTRALTDEQKLIARFWSDDPMLSTTPPGHWVSIVLQIMERDGADAAVHGEVLARLGVAVADAFIGCWKTKYEYDLLRPVTYINRVIDKAWKPLLITPPFPEYPSGHSTQSGAATAVLTAHFGEHFAFEDATYVDEGMPVRRYGSFDEAAREAAMSRLYGGIHFRAAIERGLEQGRCIGAWAAKLKTRQ